MKWLMLCLALGACEGDEMVSAPDAAPIPDAAPDATPSCGDLDEPCCPLPDPSSPRPCHPGLECRSPDGGGQALCVPR